MRLRGLIAAADQQRERLAQALAALSDVQLELDRERLARQESESLFDVVVESMSDGLLLVDRLGRIWRANDAAARLLGTEVESLVGREIGEVLGPEVPATPWELFERSAEGRLDGLERVIGSRRVPVSLSCAVVRDRHGKIEGAVYSARDLSETELLAQELSASEARWRLLAEVGEMLAAELDPQATLPAVCARLEETIGCRAAFVLVQDAAVEAVVNASPAPELDELAARPIARRSALWGALSSPRTMHVPSVRPDFPLLGASGSPSIASAAIVPLRARESVLGALVLFAADERGVTEASVDVAQPIASRVGLLLLHARLRDSLAHAEAAREADRMREELIASVSHDMQTPLSTLLGALATLGARPGLPDADRKRLYAAMRRQAASLRRLVQQFLDYSRLEVGRPLVFRARPLDVRPVVQELVDDFGSQAAIELDSADGVPLVLADADRLNQVLANLLSNAVKFSPGGAKVRISIRNTKETVEIAVADEGRGIGPADLASLFQKFQRGANAAGVPGTGVGLYISRVLVDGLGGRLTVRSRLGKGSTFTVSLPIAEDAEG